MLLDQGAEIEHGTGQKLGRLDIAGTVGFTARKRAGGTEMKRSESGS